MRTFCCNQPGEVINNAVPRIGVVLIEASCALTTPYADDAIKRTEKCASREPREIFQTSGFNASTIHLAKEVHRGSFLPE